MSWGSDVLKVNESLGLGTPAFYSNGKLLLMDSVEEKSIFNLSKKNKAILKVLYKGVLIDGFKTDITLTITLEKGERHTDIGLISNPPLPKNILVASGFVSNKNVEVNERKVKSKQLIYTFGKQSFHGDDLGMALLVKSKKTALYLHTQESHILAWPSKKGKAKYSFAAAWGLEPNALNENYFYQYLLKKI